MSATPKAAIESPISVAAYITGHRIPVAGGYAI
jgi:hypothetical protein